MRPRHAPNPTRPALTAITLIAVTLLLSGSAQAATVQQQVYNIFTVEYHADLAFTPTQMHANLTAAQAKLAATASSIDALSSTDSTAATALIDELEAQYDQDGLRHLFEASLKAFSALAKLPLTATEHKDVVLDLTNLKHALTINTAADLRSWKAAGFSRAGEPSHTTEYGIVIGVSLPSIDLPVSGSTAAIKAFTKLETKASSRISAGFSKVGDDWGTWIAAYGVSSG